MTYVTIKQVNINPVLGEDIPAGTEVEITNAPNPDYCKCYNSEYGEFFTIRANLKEV